MLCSADRLCKRDGAAGLQPLQGSGVFQSPHSLSEAIYREAVCLLRCGIGLLCSRSCHYLYGRRRYFLIKNDREYLANIPGIICDGAKISCAAKIAACLDAAFLAHHLAMNGQSYAPYTGILQEETAETISCVGQIGKDGMKETDREILKIMLEH